MFPSPSPLFRYTVYWIPGTSTSRGDEKTYRICTTYIPDGQIINQWVKSLTAPLFPPDTEEAPDTLTPPPLLLMSPYRWQCPP